MKHLKTIWKGKCFFLFQRRSFFIINVYFPLEKKNDSHSGLNIDWFSSFGDWCVFFPKPNFHPQADQEIESLSVPGSFGEGEDNFLFIFYLPSPLLIVWSLLVSHLSGSSIHVGNSISIRQSQHQWTITVYFPLFHQATIRLEVTKVPWNYTELYLKTIVILLRVAIIESCIKYSASTVFFSLILTWRAQLFAINTLTISLTDCLTGLCWMEWSHCQQSLSHTVDS